MYVCVFLLSTKTFFEDKMRTFLPSGSLFLVLTSFKGLFEGEGMVLNSKLELD